MKLTDYYSPSFNSPGHFFLRRCRVLSYCYFVMNCEPGVLFCELFLHRLCRFCFWLHDGRLNSPLVLDIAGTHIRDAAAFLYPPSSRPMTVGHPYSHYGLLFFLSCFVSLLMQSLLFNKVVLSQEIQLLFQSVTVYVSLIHDVSYLQRSMTC